MSQCVSCNNQPNDNDSLGGGTHEGTVTPMVVGIIAGTVVVFVLVLCALFYCAKLENDKTRRVLKAEGDCDAPLDAGGAAYTPPSQQRQQQQQQQLSQSSTVDDEDVEMLDEGGGDRGGYGLHHHDEHQQLPPEKDVKSRPVERRPSSVTMVAGELEDASGRASATTTRPSGVGGVKKKGIFGWGGGRKSSGRATPADNPAVTAIEMV